jgi:aspartyl/asparaginyl beta-hydroxylase (cupin superfamily)
MKTGVEGLDKLADSFDWSSIHLIKAGKCNQELLAKCPKTHAVLDKLPMPVLDGNAPEVFLSVLKPGAEIKPHYGLSNIKLTVHLGLEIPNDCAIRVGTETQSWENGKVLIFDDSFKHEAWNHSDSERKVLILELWHPDLTTLEKQGIQKIMELQHHSMQLAKNDTIESLLAEIKAKIA